MARPANIIQSCKIKVTGYDGRAPSRRRLNLYMNTHRLLAIPDRKLQHLSFSSSALDFYNWSEISDPGLWASFMLSRPPQILSFASRRLHEGLHQRMRKNTGSFCQTSSVCRLLLSSNLLPQKKASFLIRRWEVRGLMGLCNAFSAWQRKIVKRLVDRKHFLKCWATHSSTPWWWSPYSSHLSFDIWN